MSPEIWPTPEQFEARIAEVAALNRLCASLAEAEKASLAHNGGNEALTVEEKTLPEPGLKDPPPR